MDNDKKEIYFPMMLTCTEARLLLRAIEIDECARIQFSIEVTEDAHTLYHQLKNKLNAIIPQSSCEVATRDYVDNKC